MEREHATRATELPEEFHAENARETRVPRQLLPSRWERELFLHDESLANHTP